MNGWASIVAGLVKLATIVADWLNRRSIEAGGAAKQRDVDRLDADKGVRRGKDAMRDNRDRRERDGVRADLFRD